MFSTSGEIRQIRATELRALIAPWVLHVGLGPEATLSAVMTKVVLLTLEAMGAPIVEGGSDNIVAAFKQLIEAHGGTLLTGVDVARGPSREGGAPVSSRPMDGGS